MSDKAKSPALGCPDRETLQRWLIGSLTNPESLSGHIAQCQRCQSILAELSEDGSLNEYREAADCLSTSGLADDWKKVRSEVIGRADSANPASIETAAALDTRPLLDNVVTAENRLEAVDGYRIDRLLGKGGFGEVYLGWDEKLGRSVAIKLLRMERTDSNSRARFFREARAAAALDADNVARIHAVGETKTGQPYLVMEYVSGGAFNAWLTENLDESGPRFADEFDSIARYMRDAARGLEAVHSAGLIHRDVKPANILIDDKTNCAKITDFGVARVSGDVATITQSAELLGTPVYMSPEQASDSQDVTALSDVYSLGASLFEAITAQPVFRGTTQAVLRQIERDEPARPIQLNEHIPQDLSTICLKALEKSPEQRYSSAEAMASDLDRFLRREPILARPVGAMGRGLRWINRNRKVSALAALLLLSLIIGTVVSTTLWLQSRARANDLVASRKRMRTAVDSFHRKMFEGESLYWQMSTTMREEMLNDVMSYLEEFAGDTRLDWRERLPLVEDYFDVARVSHELGHKAASHEAAFAAYELAKEITTFHPEAERAWDLRSDSASIMSEITLAQEGSKSPEATEWAIEAAEVAHRRPEATLADRVRRLKTELAVSLSGAIPESTVFKPRKPSSILDELNEIIDEVRSLKGDGMSTLRQYFVTYFEAFDALTDEMEDDEAVQELQELLTGSRSPVEQYIDRLRSYATSTNPGVRLRAQLRLRLAQRLESSGESELALVEFSRAIIDFDRVLNVSPQNRVWRLEMAEAMQSHAILLGKSGRSIDAVQCMSDATRHCVDLIRTDEKDLEARLRFICYASRLHEFYLQLDEPIYLKAIHQLRFAAGDCRLLILRKFEADWAMKLRTWALAEARKIAVSREDIDESELDQSIEYWLETIANNPDHWRNPDLEVLRKQLYGETVVERPELLR